MGSVGADGAPDTTSWGSAILRAVLMVVLSFLAFVFIPNTLLGYLTTRMTPNGRDFVVVSCWGLLFLISCVVFVRLQRKEKA